MEKDDELVGICVAKDLSYVPEGFDYHYMREPNFMYAIIKMEEKMMEMADPTYKPLLSQTGVVMDIWGAALKKQHMGKKLLHKMFQLNEALGAIKGYQYSFSYASNFKTEVGLKKLSY